MAIENLNHGRRYDIDWLRVISISFLLIYHIVLMYQPWGFYIGFIQNPETNESIWIPMALLNVWRIPLLFFVSGMGVCFALRKRDWKELLKILIDDVESFFKAPASFMINFLNSFLQCRQCVCQIVMLNI